MRVSDSTIDCLELRRLLLAAPRERMREQERHMQTCSGCAAFARELAATDRAIESAFLVCVPDGLAHRLILLRDARKRFPDTAAAVFVVALTGVSVSPGEASAWDAARHSAGGWSLAALQHQPCPRVMARWADTRTSEVIRRYISSKSEEAGSIDNLRWLRL